MWPALPPGRESVPLLTRGFTSLVGNPTSRWRITGEWAVKQDKLPRQSSLKSKDLSPAITALLNLMSSVGFGRIEQLHFRAGEPFFDPPPRVVRIIKFGISEDHCRPSQQPGFVPPEQIIQLIQSLVLLQDGIVERLEIRRCLPCLMEVSQKLEQDGVSAFYGPIGGRDAQ